MKNPLRNAYAESFFSADDVEWLRKYLKRKKQFSKCHKSSDLKAFEVELNVYAMNRVGHNYTANYEVFFHCLLSNCMSMPLNDRRTSSWRSLISLRFWVDFILKLRMIVEMIDFSSRSANLWPMQLRGPAENGTKA